MFILRELIVLVFIVLAELPEEMANDHNETHVEDNDLTSDPVVLGFSFLVKAFLIHGLEVTDLHENQHGDFEQSEAANQPRKADVVFANEVHKANYDIHGVQGHDEIQHNVEGHATLIITRDNKSCSSQEPS